MPNVTVSRFEYEFPSPIGELRFTIMFDEFDKTFGGVFPSPIGELHFSIMTGGTMGVEFVMFPSPIGELHFSMLQLMLHHRNTQSFRPLSGSYISQYFISCVCLLFIFVSVPYRGATFLNCNNKKAWSWHAGERFPSPIGELHFSIVPCLQFSTDICFRPLSGSYISQ